jgi:23S rRNA pseudouridine1911/1915/1917 synthase
MWPICEGIFVEKEGVIEKPIARSSNYRKQVIAGENTKTKIRKAITRYKVIQKFKKYSLVEVFPKTGRMHQIRIHLASIGHPIIGDFEFMGIRKGVNLQQKGNLLHAKELNLTLFGKKYDFIAPIPDDFREFLANIDPALN